MKYIKFKFKFKFKFKSTDEVYVVQNHQSTKFEALKVRKTRSGEGRV